MLLRCPHCHRDLPALPAACACGETFTAVRVGGLDVVDFLGVTAPGGCGCPRDQRDAACAVDLRGLPPLAAAAPVHHPKARILRRFRGLRGAAVLDVGCREGPLGHELAADNQVFGIDCCPAKTLVGSPNLLGKGYRALWLADAAALPVRTGQADLVLATDLLEHLVEPEAALHEFRRVISDDGRLLVAVPNLVSYNNRLSILLGSGVGLELHQMLRGRSPRHPIAGVRYPDQRMHLRFFTAGSLAAALEACGFTVEARFGFDPVLSRLPSGDRLLHRLCAWTVAVGRPRS